MTHTKTIEMPEHIWNKWSAALKSGDYKKGAGKLGDDKEGYCCLGVLVKCLEGEVTTPSAALPPDMFLKRHNISFRNIRDTSLNNPYLSSVKATATDLNDYKDYTFSEIEQVLKKHVKFI